MLLWVLGVGVQLLYHETNERTDLDECEECLGTCVTKELQAIAA